MTTTLNASTSSGFVMTPDNSGNLQLQWNGIAAPAFNVYMSTNAAFTSGTSTKVTLDVENFDTASCFASSKFTPTVAGYYQINGTIRVTGTGVTAQAQIWKNGSQESLGVYTGATSTLAVSVVSCVVYLNGSTDYVELYGYGDATSGSPTFQYINSKNTCLMSGCLLRGA